MNIQYVDYKERKTNKEKVVPYDKLKPFVKIEVKTDDNTIKATFNYLKMDLYLKNLNKDILVNNSSKDYLLLWRVFLLENNFFDKTIQQNKTLDSYEKKVKNRMILDAYIRMNTMEENSFLFQTNKISMLSFFSLSELIVLSILSIYGEHIKKGFLSSNTAPVKKVKHSYNALLFFKYIFEYEIDLFIFDIMKSYTENQTNLLIEPKNVKFENIELKNNFVYKKGNEIGFNKRDLKNEEGMPIHILYQILKSKFGIFSYEMIRTLSKLEKDSVIDFSKGVIKINKNIEKLFTLSLYENMVSFIKENNTSSANAIVAEILRKKEIQCQDCKKGILMFSRGAYCSHCDVKFKKEYYNILLTQQQISILNFTKQILFFKDKRPMILYAKKEKNKYFYTVEKSV